MSELREAKLRLLSFTLDAIALYVESMASNFETKAVPAPMDAFAAGQQQVPYQQPAAQPAPAQAAPAAAPVAPVPATPQQMQQPQKAVTQENPGEKVEGKICWFCKWLELTML